MEIKKQTKGLTTDRLKPFFEVADNTDKVRNKSTTRDCLPRLFFDFGRV